MAFYADKGFNDGTDVDFMEVDSGDEFDDESSSLPLCSFILRTVRQEPIPTPAQVVNTSAPSSAVPPMQDQLPRPPESNSPLPFGQAGEASMAALATPPLSSPPPGAVASPSSNTVIHRTVNAPKPIASVPPRSISQSRSLPPTSSSLYMPYLHSISHVYSSQGYDPSPAGTYLSMYQLPPTVYSAAFGGHSTLPSFSPDPPQFTPNSYSTHRASLPDTTPRDPSPSYPVMRRWTPLEIATFERAMATFGRNWKLIDRMHGEHGIVDQFLGRFTPSHLSSKASYEVCRKRHLLKMTDEQIGIMATRFTCKQMSGKQEEELVAQYVRDIAEERRQVMETLDAAAIEAERQRLAEGMDQGAVPALGSVVGSHILA